MARAVPVVVPVQASPPCVAERAGCCSLLADWLPLRRADRLSIDDRGAARSSAHCSHVFQLLVISFLPVSLFFLLPSSSRTVLFGHAARESPRRFGPTIRGRASAISTKRPQKAERKQQTHKNANTTTNNNKQQQHKEHTHAHGHTHQPRAATASTQPPPRRAARLPLISAASPR